LWDLEGVRLEALEFRVRLDLQGKVVKKKIGKGGWGEDGEWWRRTEGGGRGGRGGEVSGGGLREGGGWVVGMGEGEVKQGGGGMGDGEMGVG